MKVDFVFDVGEANEDVYLLGKNIFGVFDGANSTNKFFAEKSGGRIAAEILMEEFSKNRVTLKEIAIEANRKIKGKMTGCGVDTSDELNTWSSTAAVVRIKERTFEWLQVADSLMLVIYRDGTYRLMVNDYDHDKHVLMVWKKYALEKKTGIKSLLRGELNANRRRINKNYGGFNGDESLEKFIFTGEESLESVKHILLFTDGLFLPKEDPAEDDDFDTFVRLFLEGGLENVKNYVRDLEKTDPNCWKYPRFKVHDDIAAISISF
jgi:hypothetical protein